MRRQISRCHMIILCGQGTKVLASFIDILGATGAGIASAVISMGVLFGAMFIGCKAAEVKGKNWQGWLVGLTAFCPIARPVLPSG